MSTKVVDAVINYWDDHNVRYLPGVSEEALSSFESRHRMVLPDDMRTFYRRTNGTCVPLNGQDHESYEFWPLSEIGPDKGYPWAMNFADYRERSWWYAIDLTNHTGHGAGSVFFMGAIGGRPLLMAHSFAEFLNLYVRSDERLFPPGAASYDAAFGGV